MSRKRVVIVGAGFGGVSAAQTLSEFKDVEIILLDRRNFHLFQPLLYQVAMAGLNDSDIAIPLRTLFRRKKNVQVVLTEVDQIDCLGHRVHFDGQWLECDYLVVCCGAKHAYFGNEQWEEVAPGLKTVEQATEIRRRVLTAFEIAEKTEDVNLRQQYLTFVIVGGGPTGVEVAGAIAEMAKHTLYKDFQKSDLSKTRVVLVEAGPRILSAFPENLSQKATEYLIDLGVEVRLNTRASQLSKAGLKLGEDYLPTSTIIWAAGVKPSSLSKYLPGEKDHQGRVFVNSDLSLPNHPNVFVIGDQSHFKDKSGFPLPGIAPVAIQQGRFLGKIIQSDLEGISRPSFQYFDKGIMATIGRSRAVVSIRNLQLSGFFAWLMWVFIHIVYLMRFRNRIFVFFQWVWSYFTFGRGARLITHKTWRFYSGEKIDLK